MGVDITCSFLQDAKSSLTKHKKCSLQASYGCSETWKLECFTKKANGLYPNNFRERFHIIYLKGS